MNCSNREPRGLNNSVCFSWYIDPMLACSCALPVYWPNVVLSISTSLSFFLVHQSEPFNQHQLRKLVTRITS